MFNCEVAPELWENWNGHSGAAAHLHTKFSMCSSILDTCIQLPAIGFILLMTAWTLCGCGRTSEHRLSRTAMRSVNMIHLQWIVIDVVHNAVLVDELLHMRADHVKLILLVVLGQDRGECGQQFQQLSLEGFALRWSACAYIFLSWKRGDDSIVIFKFLAVH